jgi:hypothetical protein
MKLVEMNWRPTDRQLRQFAAICCVALPAIAWIWHAPWHVIGILAGVGVAIAAIGMAFPKLVTPLFLGLSLIALPIGLVVGELAMLSMFYGVFLPIGWIMRFCRADALQRQFDRTAASYWHEKASPASVKSYYRQF